LIVVCIVVSTDSFKSASRDTPSVPSTDSAEEIIVRPQSGWPGIAFARFWRYRDLLVLFWWRDLRQRFLRPILGIGAAALQPLFALGAFSIIFGMVLKVETPGTSYVAAATAAMLVWSMFASAAQTAASSMISNEYLIGSIAFPRLWLPVSRVGVRAIDSLISLPILLGVLLWQGATPTLNWLWLPFILLASLMLALGVGLVIDAITGARKVLRHAVAPAFTALLLASPVAYTIDSVPAVWRDLYMLNPIAGLIDAMRWSLLSLPLYAWWTPVWAVGCTMVLVALGWVLHRALDAYYTSEWVT
jgi:lipopolysaccharide transport system permease protein